MGTRRQADKSTKRYPHTRYDGHDHDWQEFVLDDTPKDDPLYGLKVMAPCTLCGMTALDGLEDVVEAAQDAQAREQEQREALANLVLKDERALFHWSPTRHRKSIIRHGLRPGRKPTTSTVSQDDTINADWTSPVVCFADTPWWAWDLSGAMSWTESGEWDLWQTWSTHLVDPIVMPDYPGEHQRPSGIYEVRTTTPVRKRHLWLVGTRTKP
jgi:hypothetical protein